MDTPSMGSRHARRGRHHRFFVSILVVAVSVMLLAPTAIGAAQVGSKPLVYADFARHAVFDGSNVQLTGTAIDPDGRIKDVKFSVRDRDSGLWMAVNGNWAASRTRFTAALEGDPAATVVWRKSLMLSPGKYSIELFAIDNDSQWKQYPGGWIPFSVAGAQATPTTTTRPPANVGATPTTTTTTTTTTPPPVVSGTTRDPLLWPYPWNSIWNYPLGNGAALVPMRMVIPRDKTLNVEEDIIITRPGAARRDIMSHDAAWNNGVSRCESRTGAVEISNVPIPTGWHTDPGYHGMKPNHAAAILLPDMTLVETQPFHICPDGVPVSQFSAKTWQGDSILTGGKGDPRGGAHGGSGMTAFGGTIRVGEWVPGGNIPHVLKLEVDGKDNLSPQNGGYRWPALNADKGYQTKYGGTVSAAKMGSLVALPSTFKISTLQTDPAQILARTLQSYGAYIVDNTGWSAAAIAVEWGPNGRVKSEFEQVWGFPMDGHKDKTKDPAQKAFLTDMETIYANLHVVNNNTPTTIGGTGTRLAPWAPPFPNGTGGHP